MSKKKDLKAFEDPSKEEKKKPKKRKSTRKKTKDTKPKPKVDNSKKKSVADLLVRIDASKLYPPFKKKLITAVRNCRSKGSDYFVISALRTWNEQADLYARGRTESGNIVTNAEPGESAHNYGVAADGCKDSEKDRRGLQPDWNLEEYKLWAEEAERVGLEAGLYWKSFKEGPHIQLPLKKHGFTWSALQTLHKEGGLERVWQELDKHNWNHKGECVGCK